jgi:hypothetical protein
MPAPKRVANVSLAEKPTEPFGKQRKNVKNHSVHYLNENAFPVLGAACFHDGAERLCGPALTADHLAALVVGDAQLQQDGLVVLFVLADLDLVRLVDQRSGEELEQLLQTIPFAFSRRLTVPLG